MLERVARWVVQGSASGDPMSLGAAVTALNEIYCIDHNTAPQLLSLLKEINGILARDNPCGSGVCALVDEDHQLVGFAAVNLRE